MALLFYGTNAANGFDSLGHYVRDEPLVERCTAYAITPVPGCSANFPSGGGSASATAAQAVRDTAARRPRSDRTLAAAAATASRRHRRSSAQHATTPVQALLDYLIGTGRMNAAGANGECSSSPVLIGALTVLVAIVAVFLAYNANNGLPFVPSYALHVQVADAERADPRRRGAHGRRAGRARRQRHAGARRRPGEPIAVLNLKLEQEHRAAARSTPPSRSG